MKHPPPQAFGPGVNRIGDVMSHITRYGFKGVGRLARDARVSPSAISKVLNGKTNPSFLMVARITEALERELGYRIDPRELVSEEGRFPTRYACDLIGGCRGCLPEAATDEYGDTKKAFEGIKPGKWVTSRHPSGLTDSKEEAMPTDPLVGALRECSLHSLLMLTSKALTRAGFGDVEILDRRDTGQKSRHGGHEISCLAALGPLPVRVIVKVIRDDVRTRMLDELAGGVLRAGADLGLVVTPYHVSASVASKQAGYMPARVEAMDGEALASLIRCSGIAVRPSGDVDYAFLSELEAVSRRMLAFIGKERP